MVKIGFIARYDNGGLGTLSMEMARHLKPHKVLLVSVYPAIYKNHHFPERYKDFETRKVSAQIDIDTRNWLLDDIDILFTCETFYDWTLIGQCRKKGIKTVLYTMYEMTREQMIMSPDVYLCPSKLDYDTFKDRADENTIVKYLPVPVATDRLIWRKREKAHHFIHAASHGGMNMRKGTQLLLDAIPHVKEKDIKFTIYTWQPVWKTNDPRVEVKYINFKNYWQLWREGDVHIYPQDYNGISLPVIESMASGLGVITTDIYPFNEYMPKELMFKPESMYTTRAWPGLIKTQAAKINPRTIAKKIDEWANKDISKFSLYGKKWAEENSWDRLLPKYVQFLEEVVAR